MGGEAIARLMAEEERRSVEAVLAQQQQLGRAIEAVADRLRQGGRLIYCGAGTSGRLGVLDAAECPPTFATVKGQVIGLIAGGEGAILQAVEGAEDRAELGREDLLRLQVNARDCVVGIAASGRTPYVLGALAAAAAVGALRLAVVCSPHSAVAAAAEIALELQVGPEVLTGSTRLKAGTATKLALNILSTGVFVRLGKVYSNLMVDVQCSNAKLRARARRIVMQAAGIPDAEARVLLERCGGETKTAIVCALECVEPATARARLAAREGRVR